MKRLLIAGFGDIARRALPIVERRFTAQRICRSAGADLDRPETLRIAPADALLHCAPPPGSGSVDSRTANLLDALEEAGIVPSRVVYVSTSGVYGDCKGAHVDESRPVNPATPRAMRRVDAESRLRAWCEAHGSALVILRAPGIYAADRLPLERLRSRTPVLQAEDDVYTNHIHGEDLARAAARALEDDAPGGIYNIADDSELRMADWLDLVADRVGLPRPPRLPRARVATTVPAALYSFMTESRRLVNRRMKHTLGIELRYPTVHEGLAHVHLAGIH